MLAPPLKRATFTHWNVSTGKALANPQFHALKSHAMLLE